MKPELVDKMQPDMDCLKGKYVQLGVHVFAITVDAHGIVRDPQYLSNRDQTVAKCVLPQLKRWRYKPASKRGHPVAAILIITVNVDG